MQRNLLIFAGIVVLTGAIQVTAQRSVPEVVREVEGEKVYKLLEPDDIPAIRDPQFVFGADAEAQMSEAEPVMGIRYNGEIKAYSLWQLDRHEIVNDYFGKTPIAVTW